MQLWTYYLSIQNSFFFFNLQQFWCNSNCNMTLRLHLITKHSHNLTNKEKMFPGLIHVAAGKIPNGEYTWHSESLKRRKPTICRQWQASPLRSRMCVCTIVNCTVEPVKTHQGTVPHWRNHKTNWLPAPPMVKVVCSWTVSTLPPAHKHSHPHSYGSKEEAQSEAPIILLDSGL